MNQKTTTRDMTQGNILLQMILFALPLFLGNVFQLLYNTVDTLVVGNFVSKQALAAVGSTTMFVNMVVFFFNGLSIGATVVIGRYFGAGNLKKLHTAIETTMGLTFVFCIFFTVFGVLMVKPILFFMSTPEDVMHDATIYLRIYMAGISGTMIYNMASGILRAVGDTTRPLYFLILTSVLNMILDVFFVVHLHIGIAGAAYATDIAQFISAGLVLLLLSRTSDIYKLTWRDLRLEKDTTKDILGLGLPAAIQSIITSFSNVFVQHYVNEFGSSVMAGWSTYNKLDQFIMLPMSTMANAATTFVSQNTGAGNKKRADKGTFVAVASVLVITFFTALLLYIFASPATRIFIKDPEVIAYGARFLKVNVFFMLCNCINHTLAGAIRGRGDSKGPMIIMLVSFVAIRQIYLFVCTRFFINTPTSVGFGYPVGWTCCCIIELIYYRIKWYRK